MDESAKPAASHSALITAMKILVVDDHALIREGVRQILRELDDDIVVLEAGDSRSALDLLDRHADLDLVLLDLNLPGLPGFRALEEMRGRRPGLPVVVMSGQEQRDYVIESIDKGAMGFIPKSAPGRLMISALRLVLSGGVYLPAEALGAPLPDTLRQPEAPQSAPYSELKLTERQRQVLALLVQGKPNKIICRELGLAEGTVKIHVTAILKALNVSNRTQAVIEVGRRGLTFEPLSRKAAARPE